MKRVSNAEVIANLASFLASDDAANITGSIMLRDSGKPAETLTQTCQIKIFFHLEIYSKQSVSKFIAIYAGYVVHIF